MERNEAGAPRVLYISYDGAGEPLGRSQVVAYLERLAGDCQITLISFEKPDDDRAETRAILDAAGIRWVPLAYHKRPPVLSTAWDILHGALAARREVRRERVEIVHVRSYVPGMIALLAGRQRRWRLLFDIRGFWADERVEGGIWPRGWLYRFAKRCEHRLFTAADAVVTLTEASVPQIRAWLGPRDVPVRVIPTCAAVERYAETKSDPVERLVWCGSIGTIYRFGLAVDLARESGLPLLVLTRQLDAARAAVGSLPAQIRRVPHEGVPAALASGGIGLCLIGDGFANLARAPTRVAEYLAAGMPVAVTPDIGDVDRLVVEHGVGVVVRPGAPDGLRPAVDELRRLAADPATAARARALASKLFSLDAGVERYREIYGALQAP